MRIPTREEVESHYWEEVSQCRLHATVFRRMVVVCVLAAAPVAVLETIFIDETQRDYLATELWGSCAVFFAFAWCLATTHRLALQWLYRRYVNPTDRPEARP